MTGGEKFRSIRFLAEHAKILSDLPGSCPSRYLTSGNLRVVQATLS
jgi:hypothetical protein